MEPIVYITGIIVLFIMLKVYTSHKNPIRTALKSMLCSVAALTAVSYIMPYFGRAPAINMFNTFVTLTLGIPGIILLIIKFIY